MSLISNSPPGAVPGSLLFQSSRGELISSDAGNAAHHTVNGQLPLPLERLRPYLDLSPPRGLATSDVPPVVIHTPLMARESVLSTHEPWFTATHPQRIPPAPFRAEIARAAEHLGCASAASSETLEGWLQEAEGGREWLRLQLEGAVEASVLQRALLARLLITLGFQKEGQTLALQPGDPIRTPEEAYSFSTWTYAQQILMSGRNDVPIDPHYRYLHEQLGPEPEYARIRLVNCFNGAVMAARRRDVACVAFWRAEGSRALSTFTSLPEVDSFTRALMTSRFYRAMSFLPYLCGEGEQLKAEMDMWLGIARELRGSDERSRVLVADNLFPAVETAIRTEIHLGNRDAGMTLAEELAHEIEPLEPKCWLTLGEVRVLCGDIAGALEAYLRAAHLAVPFGRMAWFSAGQCYEKLNKPGQAVSCYLQSLALWPTGVSPLRRIYQLAGSADLANDSKALLEWVSRQPAWPSIQ